MGLALIPFERTHSLSKFQITTGGLTEIKGSLIQVLFLKKSRGMSTSVIFYTDIRNPLNAIDSTNNSNSPYINNC